MACPQVCNAQHIGLRMPHHMHKLGVNSAGQMVSYQRRVGLCKAVHDHLMVHYQPTTSSWATWLCWFSSFVMRHMYSA